MDKITAEEAKKAAVMLRAYCNSKPANCGNCIFYKSGCAFMSLQSPGRWKIPGDKKNKQGG